MLAGCPHPTAPRRPSGASWSRTLADVGGPTALRGFALGDALAYAALTHADGAGAATSIEAIGATGDPRWTWAVPALAGPIAFAGRQAVAAIAPAPGQAAIPIGATPLPVRGDPGAALVGLDAATGAPAWTLALGATQWCVISAIAGHASGDVVAVGSFAGTLRAGAAVVTSAGSSDGFAIRVDARGAVTWLVRVGAAGADALTAVALGGGPDLDTIAVAGAITGEADLRGTSLVAHNPRIPTQDVAVAVLDATGAPRWGQTLGGDSDDAAAGVGVLPGGGVALAATVRDVIAIGGDREIVRGPSDALVATFDRSGAITGHALLGGLDYDGARALAIAHDGTIAVAGWFAGVLRGPAGELTADGGDDGYLARLDATAHVLAIEAITGPGREEIAGLAASATHLAIAVAHTAGVTAFGVQFAAPVDPMGGVAVFVRP